MNQAEQFRETRAERFGQAKEHLPAHNSRAEHERRKTQEEAERKHREQAAQSEAEQKSTETRRQAEELIAEQNRLAQAQAAKECSVQAEKVRRALEAAAEAQK